MRETAVCRPLDTLETGLGCLLHKSVGDKADQNRPNECANSCCRH